MAMGGSEMANPELPMEEGMAPEGAMPMAEGAPAEGGMGAMPTVDPALVMAASSVLVAAGLLGEATEQLTPEVIAAMQSLVDKIRPGLYDLSVPEELMEVMNGLANGTIGLDIAGDAAAAGPGPGGPGGPAGPLV